MMNIHRLGASKEVVRNWKGYARSLYRQGKALARLDNSAPVKLSSIRLEKYIDEATLFAVYVSNQKHDVAMPKIGEVA